MDWILKAAKTDYANKKPQDVAKRLHRMYNMAKLNMKNKEDEKEAFIYFKRWFNAIEWIKQTKDYKQCPDFYKLCFSDHQVEEVKFILDKLEKSLTLKYAPEKHNLENNDTLDSTTGSVPGKEKSTDEILNLPETPTDEPLALESDEFLSCQELFQLLQPNIRLLIIDVRLENDYMSSRIKSNRCLNIPGNKIKSGVIASSFEKLLSANKEASSLFSRRSAQYVDTVVLLDWSTTHATFFPNIEVRVLKDILQHWDPGTKCAKIKVLEGGYTEWLNRYPAYVTNSNVKVPDISSDAMDEILKEVEYPEWLNSDDRNSAFNSMRIQSLPPKNLKCKTDEPINPILPAEKLPRAEHKHSYITTDPRASFYNGQNDSTNIFTNKITSEPSTKNQNVDKRDSESMFIHENEIFSATHKFPNKSALHNIIPKPSIDRSSKPPSLISQYYDCTNLLILMRQQYELVKAEKNFEDEILKIETALHYQDMDNSTNRRLVKEHWETVKTKLEEVKKKKAEVKTALTIEKVDESLMSPEDKKEKHTLDLSIGTVEQRLMKLSIERKKLYESIHEQEQKRHLLIPKRNENGIHKEPLKFDCPSPNSGLKRSHSSPNLAQLDDRKVPHVDRSSKPQVPQLPNRVRNNHKFSQWRLKDREDRMEPVYRNVKKNKSTTKILKLTAGKLNEKFGFGIRRIHTKILISLDTF